MPILLGLLTMLLYLGFYVNDRIVLEEAARESAVYAAATCPSDRNQMVSAANKKSSEIIAGKIFSTQNISLNTEIKGSYVVVNVSGNFVVPIFNELAQNVFDNNFSLNTVGKGIITTPVNKIRLVEIAKLLSGGDS